MHTPSQGTNQTGTRHTKTRPALTALLVFMLLFTSSPFMFHSPSVAVAAVAAEDPYVDIAGSVPPFATQIARQSAPSKSTPVELTIVLTPRNEADLQKTANRAASSTNFQPLSQAEFIRTFSPTQATFDEVKSYLQSQSLSVKYESADRLVIAATAPSQAVADAAFNTTSVYGSYNGNQGYVNVTPVRVPAKLATSIKSVVGFDTITTFQTFHNLKKAPEGPRQSTPGAVSDPHLPASLRQAYNVNNVPFNGTGTKVAITLWSAPTSSPSVSYNDWATEFGFSPPNVTFIGTTSNTSAAFEADLDVENVTATAPSTAIRFYLATSPNFSPLLTSLSQAISDNVDAITNSWGACEPNVSSSTYNAYHTVFSSAASQGIPVLLSSGDSGIYECGTSNGNRASFPAGDDLVNAIGGTNVQLTGTADWSSETGWSCPTPSNINTCLQASGGSSGGGVSVYAAAPSYQTGNANRQVPDFSSNADPASGMYARLGPSNASGGNLYYGGGTSASSPWMAGSIALAVQKRGGKVGNPNPTLYNASPRSSVGVYDVTSGFNGANAGADYDLVTGIGSIKDTLLFVNALGVIPPAPNPLLGVTPTSLTFNAIEGGTNPPAQTISVTNVVSGSGVLTYTGSITGSFISVTPTGGTVSYGVTNTHSVSVTSTSLTAGTYTGTITLQNTTVATDTKTVSVTLNVAPAPPANPLLGVTPTSLVFSGTVGSAIPTQTISVTNIVSGSGILTYTGSISVSSPPTGTWLNITPTGGSVSYGATNTHTVSVTTTGLSAGTYTGTITLQNSSVATDTKTVNVTLNLSASPPPTVTGGFHPLPQFRLYDSRTAFGGPGPFATGETRTITAVNNTGIPSNPPTSTVTIPASAKSIVVNFTAVQVSKGGFLTAYQTGISQPTISTLNWYYANQIVGNSAIVDLNSAGQFNAYFGASSGDLTVDVVGYIDNVVNGPAIPSSNPLSGVLTTTALTYKPVSSVLTSVRAYDSRPAFGGTGPLATGVTRTVQVRGTAGVPSTAKAVIINLTAINAVNRGFLAAFPGSSNPGTASVSFNGSVQPVIGNLVVVYLDSAGAITILAGGTNTSADFVIDVFGYYDNSNLTTGSYVGLPAPVRHYDSRISQGGAGPITANATITAPVSVKFGTSTPTGVPANARAVVIHLAVANTVSNGFLALYGVSYQGTSSLNWAGNGQLVSNLAVVDLNQLDSLKIKEGGNPASQTDFIIDIVGYIP